MLDPLYSLTFDQALLIFAIILGFLFLAAVYDIADHFYSRKRFDDLLVLADKLGLSLDPYEVLVLRLAFERLGTKEVSRVLALGKFEHPGSD